MNDLRKRNNRTPIPQETPSKERSTSTPSPDFEPKTPTIQDKLCPSFWQTFALLFAFRAITSVAMPFIADCDETFNYWEPLHYLQYGYGFQTWEYSPKYAIRSYFYVLIYGLPAFIIDQAVNFVQLEFVLKWKRVIVFYGLRVVLAGVCSLLEARYYRSVVEHVSSRIGRYLLWILLLSPGMWQASTAFLPSTFAMYTTMWCFTSLLKSYHLGRVIVNWRQSWASIGKPVFCLAAGAIIGWPFSGAVGIPLVAEEVLLRSWKGKDASNCLINTIHRISVVVITSIVSCLVLLTPLLIVDFAFYRQLTLVPWNIVAYNVFGAGTGGGSELYGTSPWHYYLVNGFLNFNIAFILALASAFVLISSFLWSYGDAVSCFNVAFLASSVGRPYEVILVQLAPLYLWLLIFTLQPHKEERFLYVVYPSICFNAAVCLSFIRAWISRIKIVKSSKLPQFLTSLILVCFSLLAISRIAAIYTSYSSSISIYHKLHITQLQNDNQVNVCLGQEWYRLPSHYLLPDNARVLWVDTGSGGQLPKYFTLENEIPRHLKGKEFQLLDILPESWRVFLESRPATWYNAPGFNNQNKKETSRFSSPYKCDILITMIPHGKSASESEVGYLWLTQRIKEQFCLPFLDRERGDPFHRAFYLPFMSRNEHLHWAEYCYFRLSK